MTSNDLKDEQQVTVNIPFTYIIGEIGYHTNKILRTVEDCEDEVRAELDNQTVYSTNVVLKSVIDE